VERRAGRGRRGHVSAIAATSVEPSATEPAPTTRRAVIMWSASVRGRIRSRARSPSCRFVQHKLADSGFPAQVGRRRQLKVRPALCGADIELAVPPHERSAPGPAPGHVDVAGSSIRPHVRGGFRHPPKRRDRALARPARTSGDRPEKSSDAPEATENPDDPEPAWASGCLCEGRPVGSGRRSRPRQRSRLDAVAHHQA